MEAAGAAVLLSQSQLTGPKLAQTITTILDDPERMRAMGAASATLRRIDAAESIVRECCALIGDHHDTNQPLGATGV
jgi:UDP-N-acetylglucosamine--N-acetylmuramyl-(pentapeptide) pyrophosphoryl-undecaprenol N-acetylglucosamine transferase